MSKKLLLRQPQQQKKVNPSQNENEQEMKRQFIQDMQQEKAQI